MDREAAWRALDVLSGAERDPNELEAAARRLFGELEGVALAGESADEAGSQVLGGVAIGPADAGRCLLDVKRTARFVRALTAAVAEALRRFDARPIQLLYAGCGPFATLALPLARRFTPQELRITLVDVHRRSLDGARRVTEALGLEASFAECAQGDATRIELTDAAPRVVVAEVMQRALDREPQLALTAGLARRLRKDAIWIPQRIALDAWLADPDAETCAGQQAPERHFLARAMDLTAASSIELWDARRPFGERESLPPLELRVPAEIDGRHLMIATTLELFGAQRLEEGDSGLTSPKVFHRLGRLPGGARVELRYLLGDQPGFRARLVD